MRQERETGMGIAQKTAQAETTRNFQLSFSRMETWTTRSKDLQVEHSRESNHLITA